MTSRLSRNLFLSSPRFAGPIVLLIMFVVGCGENGGVVSGKVTYDGKTIESGMVTFTPAKGMGSMVGTDIVDGKYKATGVSVGDNIVQVIAIKKVNHARSTEELAKLAAQQLASGNDTGIIEPADIVPANAQGNNNTVAIQSGNNTLDLILLPPLQSE